MWSKISSDLNQLGWRGFLTQYGIAAVNRFALFKVLAGMTLTPDSIDANILKGGEHFTCRFLSAKELREYSLHAENDLPPDFVEQAAQREDKCFAILDGAVLASYGFYSTQPTLLIASEDAEKSLYLRFNDSFVYMFRGFTHPDYRGQRLHALGMGLAMQHFCAQGKLGLISYVEAQNFSSLKSVERLGYRIFGRIYILRLAGNYLRIRTKHCARHGFDVGKLSNVRNMFALEPCSR